MNEGSHGTRTAGRNYDFEHWDETTDRMFYKVKLAFTSCRYHIKYCEYFLINYSTWLISSCRN